METLPVPEPRRPVFILGSPRTGSSVLHWSLCQSPAFWGSSESDFLHDLAPAVINAWERGTALGEYSWLVREDVGEDEFVGRFAALLEDLFQSRAGDAHWVDQTPMYVHVAPELARLFPRARFLVLFRDGRQAAPSIQSLRGHPFPEAVEEWCSATERGLALLSSEPARSHPVCFEDLVLNTRDCLARVFDFLGEPLCEESVRFVRTRAPINTSFADEPSADKLRPRWPGWPWWQRQAFQRLSGGLLQRLGYEESARWVWRPEAAAVADPAAVTRRVVATLDEARGAA